MGLKPLFNSAITYVNITIMYRVCISATNNQNSRGGNFSFLLTVPSVFMKS